MSKNSSGEVSEFTHGQNKIVWDPGEANPKQKLFYQARTLYVGYGGAKGGGKSHAVRVKSIGGALHYPGIRILIMRRTYPELESNQINPILRMVPPGVSSYNGSTRILRFENGSIIKFGHWAGDQSELEYQGQEYDWIFIDEATQFSERAFNYLGGCLRGVNDVPKRMYITCNPGGVGHRWVKRLFIDRQYKTDSTNPEENENPDDYTFIFATVEDNTHLLASSPGYLRMLSNMPEDVRNAYRYGDWDAIGGNYFPEFSPATHVCEAFAIPKSWQLYRTFDYGLDMFACYWAAVDEDGRSWVFREFTQAGLIVKDAAAKIHDNTLPGESVVVTYAPPDMWNRQKDTGKTMAEIFLTNGVNIVKADNNRVQGHMMMKDAMSLRPVTDPYVKQMFPGRDRMPGFMVFKTCKELISDVQDIQADENNPDDCAKQPHEVTHTVDAARYFCVSRTLKAEPISLPEIEEDDEDSDYDEFMCGGAVPAAYVNY